MRVLNMTNLELATLINEQQIMPTGILKKTHINDVLNILKAFKDSEKFQLIFDKIFEDKFAKEKWNLSTLKSYRRSINRMAEFLESPDFTPKESNIVSEQTTQKEALDNQLQPTSFDVESVLGHFEQVSNVVEHFRETKASDIFDNSQLKPIAEVCLNKLKDEIALIEKIIKAS